VGAEADGYKNTPEALPAKAQRATNGTRQPKKCRPGGVFTTEAPDNSRTGAGNGSKATQIPKQLLARPPTAGYYVLDSQNISLW